MKQLPRVLALVLTLTCLQVGCTSDRRRLEELATRWRLLFNTHDVDGLTALYADRGAFTTPGMVYLVRSPIEMQSVLDALWHASPDMRISAVHQLVAANNRIAFVWELTRTLPSAATASKLFGATFITVKDGLIQEQLTVTAR